MPNDACAAIQPEPRPSRWRWWKLPSDFAGWLLLAFLILGAGILLSLFALFCMVGYSLSKWGAGYEVTNLADIEKFGIIKFPRTSAMHVREFRGKDISNFRGYFRTSVEEYNKFVADNQLPVEKENSDYFLHLKKTIDPYLSASELSIHYQGDKPEHVTKFGYDGYMVQATGEHKGEVLVYFDTHEPF